MRSDGDNPCIVCEEAGHGDKSNGCGKHAVCKKYLKYYALCRERDKERHAKSVLNAYTKDAIERVKEGTRSNMKKLRPKGDQ